MQRCAGSNIVVSRTGAVIVGAGPGGYTAAMALAKNGFKDVRVLERAPSADVFNPSKAFVYALFPAGKNALRHLGMTHVDQIGALRTFPARVLPVSQHFGVL